MIDLAQGGLSHDEVLRALSFEGAFRRVRYELQLLRGETALKALDFEDFTLGCDYLSPVKYSGRFTLRADPEIRWRSDRLRLVMALTLGGRVLRYPFPPLRAARVTGNDRLTVEAQDDTALLARSSLGERVLIRGGTRYTEFLTGLLEGMGFRYVLIEPSAAVFATDREDWEPETPALELCNELLAEIGYRSLEATRFGGLRAGPYEPPNAALAHIRYRAGPESILFPQTQRELRSDCRPNRFIGYVSNPELPPMRCEYRNQNPASPTSPLGNGGYTVTAARRFDNVADLKSLEKNVRRWAVETEQQYEYAELRTAVMPHHEVREILAVDGAGCAGIYTEVGWTIERAGMTHRLRRSWMD